jgi:anti-anti-sigma factor
VPLVEVAVQKTLEGMVVRVKGAATFAAAGALADCLPPLTARRPPLVTLDLSELHFLSTLTVGVLLAYRRAVIRAGGRVRLAPAPRPQVHDALVATGLIELFEAGEETDKS